MVTVADFGIYYQIESWGHLYLSKFEFQGARLRHDCTLESTIYGLDYQVWGQVIYTFTRMWIW
jgi:hypothetical protein